MKLYHHVTANLQRAQLQESIFDTQEVKYFLIKSQQVVFLKLEKLN